MDKWSTYHTFKDSKTQIQLNWEKEFLWIRIGDYSRRLSLAEVEVFKRLLNYIFQEKIEFATGNNITTSKSDATNQSDSEEIIRVEEETIGTPKENQNKLNTTKVNGKISVNSKGALLIMFSDDKEIWIPKSTIHTYDEDNKNTQLFEIDTWIFDKNKILA